MRSNFMAKPAYALMLVSLNAGYLLIRAFTAFHFLLPVKKRKKDVIFYPFTQAGSIGYTLRIEQYIPYLKKEGLQYEVAHVMHQDRVTSLFEGGAVRQYYLFHIVLWKRIFQTLKARNFKTAFVQRGLFPFYPELKEPHLEKLLRKLNARITFDYWDAVWINNEAIFDKIVKNCDTISCVNDFIMDHFAEEKAKKVLFPIGLNLSNYIPKTSYQINGAVRFFYTGQPYNLGMFLNIMEPVFSDLKKQLDFKLVVVSRGRMKLDNVETEFHDYDEKTFYKIMHGCDIGLFAIEDSEVGLGKMAMKTLDYMASGLPSVVTPIGLSPFTKDNENALFARTDEEWISKLLLLIEDEQLRERLGRAGRKSMEDHHDLDASYLLFKTIVGF